MAVVTLGAGPETVCRGLGNVRAGRPVDPDTVFRIASVTKTMTAIGLMRLYDDGRFQLDDPVNDYLKTFRIQPPPGGVDVTFRHLLT
ncbi:MAG: serine hydrolase domain-containing protein, partial [Acidimicrobiales bacterium]